MKFSKEHFRIFKLLLYTWSGVWGFIGAIGVVVALVIGAMTLYDRVYPPPVSEHLDEYIFASQNYFVQALADSGGKVWAFSVTTRQPTFNPEITILKNAFTVATTTDPLDRSKWHSLARKIILGKTKYADIGDEPDDIALYNGAHDYHYQEEYYFGNLGEYQTYIFASNESGYDANPQELFMPVNSDPIERDNPDLANYRKNSVINTYEIVGPFEKDAYSNLKTYLTGPNYNQIRVIPQTTFFKNQSDFSQLDAIAKLSTEIDISFFKQQLGEPIIINRYSTWDLSDIFAHFKNENPPASKLTALVCNGFASVWWWHSIYPKECTKIIWDDLKEHRII
jgi:hypothetical protein